MIQRVASCAFFPGEALGGGGAVDVIDTGWEVERPDTRVYIGVQHAIEIGAAAGCASPHEKAAMTEALGLAEQEITRLEAQLALAEANLADADRLRESIAYTLERGVVTDPKKLTVGLRHKPGHPRIDLDQPLLPV